MDSCVTSSAISYGFRTPISRYPIGPNGKQVARLLAPDDHFNGKPSVLLSVSNARNLVNPQVSVFIKNSDHYSETFSKF